MLSFGRFPRLKTIFATALAAGMMVPAPVGAQGDLLIAPTRLVVNGGGSAEVVLSNIGSKPATYRISLELRRMMPDGDLEDVDEANASPNERAALAMIRYAPRRITLPPNQPQSVRISARPPAELADGEYRVHLSFRAVPEATSVEATAAAQPATGFAIRLTPIYGLTIPLIVRKGQLTGGATISNAAVEREGAATFFKLDMARSGNRSIYGEVRVMARGVKQPAYLVRGIGIYPELTNRQLRVAISPQQAAALKGPMIVEYREMPEVGGKLIASANANF